MFRGPLFGVVMTLVTLAVAVAGGLAVSVLLTRLLAWRDRLARGVGFGAAVAAAGLVFVGYSAVVVPGDMVGHLTRKYGGDPLPAGRILADPTQNGPQADVLGPGVHLAPFLLLTHDVSFEPLFQVPEGQVGTLVAKDGAPLAGDQSFADAFDPEHEQRMAEDAGYFLANGGRKGPQTTVLKPGAYRLNRFLWDVRTGPATEIKAGFVGVVLSNVWSRVDFGNLKRAKPAQDQLDARRKPAAGADGVSVPLVPVGGIGVWDEPLTPGFYYIHPQAYKVQPMDVRIQTLAYRGGFPRRHVDLAVDDGGNITQTERVDPAQDDRTATDRAIPVIMEGWTVNLEVRVIGQVPPDAAPFVMAGVGDIAAVADRVVTPNVRSVVRGALGGDATVTVREEVADPKAPGGKRLVEVTRKPRVLDLNENRAALERAVFDDLKRLCGGTRVTVTEVRFGDPGIPPELLLARKREQLAQQLLRSYQQEQLAQEERVRKERTKAEAEAQQVLARAEVERRASETRKETFRNDGLGEKEKLMAIAEGQKAQVDVLGKQEVVQLRQFELTLEKALTYFEKHPDVLRAMFENAHKFVPDRVITVNGDGKTGGPPGLAGPLAVFGDMMSPSAGRGAADKR